MSTSRAQSWTIDSGDQQSNSYIEKHDHDELVGLDWPAAFTGATVTFQVADNPDTVPTADHDWEGAVYQITVNDGRTCNIDPRVFSGRRYIWIKSASAEAADREITPRFREWR